MDFPREFFDDEIREGFFVSSAVKHMWAAQIEVLLELDKVCKKHNIRWYIDCGTLLGAVRHGGFVPWDDDLDICMLRDDYNRFIQIPEEEFPEGYHILNCHNLFYDFLSRVVNHINWCYSEELMSKYHNFVFGVGVDVFPLDYIPKDIQKQNNHKMLVDAILGFHDILQDENYDAQWMEQIFQQLEALCDTKLDRTKPLEQQLYIAAEQVCSMYGPEVADSVVFSTYWSNDGSHVYPIKCFDDVVMVDFEGIKLPAPIEFNKVLEIEYGDYMRIVKGGSVHDYPGYEAQEDLLIEKKEYYPFRYKYSTNDLEDVARKPSNRPCEQAVYLLELICKAHGSIQKLIGIADTDSVLKLLENCQNGAVRVGTMLEEYYGECSAVKSLEEYCEALYQCYQLLTQQQDCNYVELATQVYLFLNEYISVCKNEVEALRKRKEIVLIIYRAKTWEAIRPVWEELCRDNNNDIFVIIPPFYEAKADGSLGEMYDESLELSKLVGIVPYDQYDFENRHPDVIITQNPYDECNYSTSVHPFYYSRNLKQYTDCLIHIPYFVMDDIVKTNEIAWKTMQFFCTVPGVVLADRVYVQSDAMRVAYIDRLTEMAGEETRKNWEDKIFVNKCISQEGKKERVIPSKLALKWEDILSLDTRNDRRIVMLHLGIAVIEQYGMKALDKLERVLKIFEETSESIILLWRDDAITCEVLKKKSKAIYTRYQSMIDKYNSARWGIYDNELTEQELVDMVDAYYGDGSRLARKCEVAKLPVMLMNVDV